jgi:predicted RNA binding protein YcfA (HicA-like mRNA interferase family)
MFPFLVRPSAWREPRDGWRSKVAASLPAKGGHLILRLGGERTVLPMHGKGHELPRGTVIGIKAALGLK